VSYRVGFTPEFRSHLIELNRFIAAAGSPEVADRYTDAIAGFCASLATFPERGIRRDDIRPGLRITNYRKRAVIAFVVDTASEEVSVVDVFYGGRDYVTILADRD